MWKKSRLTASWNMFYNASYFFEKIDDKLNRNTQYDAWKNGIGNNYKDVII